MVSIDDLDGRDPRYLSSSLGRDIRSVALKNKTHALISNLCRARAQRTMTI